MLRDARGWRLGISLGEKAYYFSFAIPPTNTLALASLAPPTPSVTIYILQLFTPLNFLGTVYNALVMAFVDLGNLSEVRPHNTPAKSNFTS